MEQGPEAVGSVTRRCLNICGSWLLLILIVKLLKIPGDFMSSSFWIPNDGVPLPWAMNPHMSHHCMSVLMHFINYVHILTVLYTPSDTQTHSILSVNFITFLLIAWNIFVEVTLLSLREREVSTKRDLKLWMWHLSTQSYIRHWPIQPLGKNDFPLL